MYLCIMGFLKKLKDTAEKGMEKGAELGKKGIEKDQSLAPRRMMQERKQPKKAKTGRDKTSNYSASVIFYS
jgi:hypothetical protein